VDTHERYIIIEVIIVEIVIVGDMLIIVSKGLVRYLLVIHWEHRTLNVVILESD